uniref:Uncharacterized protein n=1 Tax=Myoviridae sp. ct4vg1 TaxID=2825033 RepID=A0A8S5Q1H7_9CAUD|nr:MAG TPA: hypothetical protein [Myoviridae sp. ct4vg1]
MNDQTLYHRLVIKYSFFLLYLIIYRLRSTLVMQQFNQSISSNY